MSGFFFNVGKMVGQNVRKANWVMQALTGNQEEALRAEQEVGRDLAKGYLREMPLDPDPEVQEYIEKIGARLRACVANPQQKFHYHVVLSQEFNAFALPGGYIFVMRPLLELCDWQTEEIAFVLGHEMGHVIGRHAISRLMASSVFTSALARFPIGGLLGSGIIHLVSSLLNQGYSREQEFEADAMGMKLVKYAGFDPKAARRLIVRLGSLSSETGPMGSYFSSHPPTADRLAQIDRQIQGNNQ